MSQQPVLQLEIPSDNPVQVVIVVKADPATSEFVKKGVLDLFSVAMSQQQKPGEPQPCGCEGDG